MPTKKQPMPGPRKPVDARSVTSEDIAAHLDAFAAAGGKVEVLGVTRVLKRVDEVVVSPTPPRSRR
ncbi:MAG: hypothetical protein HOQ02_07385 [Lysobacter sp.]|nr:hypothetical protein [Lysobacter sp.]